MNKTEAARMSRMATLLSLHSTGADPIPPDVMPPTERGSDTEGWMYNTYTREVYRAWSTAYNHGLGTFANQARSTTSQNSISLYSTRTLALQAMRRELEFEFATKLHAIDLAIADAKAGD